MASENMEISLPLELHPFVIRVLDDPHLQQRLASIAEAKAFVEEALKVAAEQEMPLNAEILASTLRPDPLGLGRFTSAPLQMDNWPPVGWLPTRTVQSQDGTPAFDWLWFGPHRHSRPFFEEDVRQAGAMPFNWLFRARTSLQALISGYDSEPEIPLAGLIFHMSRCGSTLLSQMFAAVPDCLVSSEPEPLSGMIQWIRLASVDQDSAITAMRAIVAALGRDSGTGAKHHLIKAEAWNAHSIALFRAAFPSVNWVFLYRNSVEVLVSLLRQPAIHTVENLMPKEVVGLKDEEPQSREEFAALVVAKIGESIISHQHLGGGLIVGYPDIIDAATTSIPAHFGLALSTDAIQLMAEASKRDSKEPYQRFKSDISTKHAAKTIVIEAAAARWMRPVEYELDQLSQACTK